MPEPTLATVTLKNGAEVPEVVVKTTMINLELIFRSDYIVFYDLVTSARDASYRLFGDNGARLVDLVLIESVNPDGTATFHTTVRDIVLSAVEGEDFDMKLVTPVAP